MDIENLTELLALVSNGTNQTLNLSLATLIKHSLAVLQSQKKLEKMYFWGCINSAIGTYFIAFGHAGDVIRNRKYFYSSDCLNWIYLSVRKGNRAGVCIEGAQANPKI